jgi:hypothetical protein
MCKALDVSKLRYVLFIIVGEIFMFAFVNRILSCALLMGQMLKG